MLEIKSKYILYGYVQISASKIFEDKVTYLNRKVNALTLLIYIDLTIFNFNHCPVTYMKHIPISKITLISRSHRSCPVIIV